MPGNVELELLSTDELLNELKRRFDHGCFAGMTIDVTRDERGDCDSRTIMRFWGNKLTAWGAAGLIQYHISTHIKAEQDAADSAAS